MWQEAGVQPLLQLPQLLQKHEQMLKHRRSQNCRICGWSSAADPS